MPDRKPKPNITLSRSFLRGLAAIVLIAFCVSMFFLWTIQTRMARRNAESLLRLNIQDVRDEVGDAVDAALLQLTHSIADALALGTDTPSMFLEAIASAYDVPEINIIGDDGIIISSTNPDFVGFDMHSGAQAAEFVPLGEGTITEYVQAYQSITYDAGIQRKYAGVTFPKTGYVQVGYDAARFQRDIDREVVGATRNRHIGAGGMILIADDARRLVSDPRGNEGAALAVTGIDLYAAGVRDGEVFPATVYGEKCTCLYVLTDGYFIIAAMPDTEVLLQRDTSVSMTAVLEVLVFVALFAMLFALVRKLVVRNLDRVNDSLARITGGDLDEVVDVRSSVEFSDLSDDINETVSTLKQYIAEAAARIDQELALAESIQLSALPSVFPPFPERTEFSLYATMHAAKTVGGDFYDFYLIDDRTLAFLVADVSGKGIPGAMFMMTGKTVVRGYAEQGAPPAETLRRANDKLCEGNDAEMFITCWLGFLDTATGAVRFGNAGHNPPVLVRGGAAEFIPQRSNLALAAMEGIPYREQQLQLQPGDLLFLYTDGVTEGTDAAEELFGNDRLLAALGRDFGAGEAACRGACEAVKAAMDAFVGDAPQFDDITMLCLYYGGPEG